MFLQAVLLSLGIVDPGTFTNTLNIARYYGMQRFRWIDGWFCALFCLLSDLWLTAAFIKGPVRRTETIANE